MTEEEELERGVQFAIKVADAAVGFARDHGPVPKAAEGDVDSKLRVGSLLVAQLNAQGLKLVLAE